MRTVLLITLLLTSIPVFAQSNTIRGRILDQSTKDPIPYVNIGIPLGQIGTVSRPDGHFELTVPDSLQSQRLMISAIGYKTRSFDITQLLKENELAIVLEPKIYDMDPITVQAFKLKEQSVGISWNGLVKVVGQLTDDNLGSEFALGMECKRYPCLIKQVNISVANNDFTDTVFRLNIYDSESGKPARNILRESILVQADVEEGWLEIPVAEDSIQVDDDFFVGIEWIQDSDADSTRKLNLRARFLGDKRTWVREGAQAKWEHWDLANLVISADVLN